MEEIIHNECGGMLGPEGCAKCGYRPTIGDCIELLLNDWEDEIDEAEKL